MKPKTLVVLLAILFVNSSFSLAQASAGTFGLWFINKIYIPEEEILINFDLKMCTQSFRILPSIDRGRLEFYDDSLKTWKPLSTAWILAPILGDTFKIRINSVADKKVSLHFDFQNIKTGEITKSADFGVWISDAFKNYIEVLNSGILLK